VPVSEPSLRPLPLAIGSLVAGKYRIDAVLGSGGMGTVFAAVNLDLGRPVAIKVLHTGLAGDDELARRLRQEARAAAAIGHRGIVDVLDLGTTEEGDPFIVMERLDGEPLGARLADRARLRPVIAVDIVIQALDALAAAHAKGILHRDLKPDNIFLILHPAPAVKLVDFGLSKQQGDDLSITRSGVVMGTPLYMSPEQARGAWRDVGPASDLYAMGAILYQALSGVPPHVATNYNEMLAKILMQQPTPLAVAVPELPVALTELVHQLLAKDPAARPTAVEAATRLRAIADTLDESELAFSPTLQPDNASDHELAPLVVTEPALAPPPVRALDVTVASLPPEPIRVAPAIAPATSARPRRTAWLGVAAAVLAIAVGVIAWVATRVPSVAPLGGPPPADAAPAVERDAARRYADAAVATDVALPPPPADAAIRRDPPRRDAAPAPRDATMAKPPPAPPPDAGDGLDIDPTNPLGR